MSDLQKTNEWSNFSGYADFDGEVENFSDMQDADNFLGLSKRGKERRKMKKELRSQGMSRKEARKMALQMVPRSKKKYLALQTEAGNPPEEIQTLQNQGVISTDPYTAKNQIVGAINENISDGTQARGSGEGTMAGMGGGSNKTMLYVGIAGAVAVAGYFMFFRK